MKEYSEAQSTFEELLKDSLENVDFMAKLAQALSNQGKFDEALELYEKILSKNPKNLDCLLNMSKIYYEKGNYEKALEILEEIKGLSPDNNDALLLSLKCRSELCDPDNQEDYEKIIEEFLSRAKENESSPDFHLSFAKIYAKNGELSKALESCKKTVETNTDDVKAYQLLGLIQLVKQDFEGAKATLNIALGFDPKNEETHNIFSYVLCQQVDNCPLHLCREKYYKLIQKYLK